MQPVQRTQQAGRVALVLPPGVFELLKDIVQCGTDLTPTLRQRLVIVCEASPGPCWCGQHVNQAGVKIRTVEVQACSKCGVLTVASDLLNGVCPTCYPTPARQAPAQETPNGQAGPAVPPSPDQAS